jgi:hypothetical protein
LSEIIERDDPVRAWLSLPRRIYLDTSTLQKLYDFGGEIFEDEPFEPVGRAAQVEGLADEIDALRMIFMVNERAMFEFVVTEASLREVVSRARPGYTQWVYDVLDAWLPLGKLRPCAMRCSGTQLDLMGHDPNLRRADQAHSGTTDATRTEHGIHAAGNRETAGQRVFRWAGIGSL